MIAAKKSLWFEKIFAVYNRNLLKRRFSKFRTSNLKSLTENKQPQIIFVNHSSWWDGLVAFEISHRARLNSFIMMEEKNLRKYFLFRRLGAFSVNKNNLREINCSLDYASALLANNQSKTLWIFPQGKIEPHNRRPIKFYSGIVKILKSVENCRLIPVAVSYNFSGDFKPEILVKIGDGISTGNLILKNGKNNVADELAGVLTDLLDQLREEIATDDLQSYENILT